MRRGVVQCNSEPPNTAPRVTPSWSASKPSMRTSALSRRVCGAAPSPGLQRRGGQGFTNTFAEMGRSAVAADHSPGTRPSQNRFALPRYRALPDKIPQLFLSPPSSAEEPLQSRPGNRAPVIGNSVKSFQKTLGGQPAFLHGSSPAGFRRGTGAGSFRNESPSASTDQTTRSSPRTRR